jgi:hypothetical protein
LCRQEAEGIENHDNEHFRGIGQGDARQKKKKKKERKKRNTTGLNFSGGHACYRSSD